MDLSENLITWNGPNFLTIGLMSLVFAALLGLACAVVVKVTRK